MWFDVPVADGEDPGIVELPAAGGNESIWSTDEIPVRDAPLDVVWAPRPDATHEVGSLAPPRTFTDSPVEPIGEDVPQRRGIRSKLLIGGGLVVAFALVVSVMARSDAGDESADPAPTASTSPTTDGPPTTDADLDDRTGESTGESAAESAAASADGTPSATPIEVELPPAVAAIQTPTEIVMISNDGLVHTLSLPSGRVRSVALDDSLGGGQSGFGNGIVVAPEATATASSDAMGLVIVPRAGPPITVDQDEFGSNIGGIGTSGWWRAGDGAARFVVTVYPSNGSTFTLASVGLDGDVTPLVTPQAVSNGFGQTTPMAPGSSTTPVAPTRSTAMATPDASTVVSSSRPRETSGWYASATTPVAAPSFWCVSATANVG